MADVDDGTGGDAGGGADDDLASLARIEADLDGVDAVLGRLEAADFGSCARCGAPIALAALADDPFTTRCPAHLLP